MLKLLLLPFFQELLGLGLELPGMTSRGTMEREDDLPQSMITSSSSSLGVGSGSAKGPKLRQTLALRAELLAEEREDEAMSQTSELMNESVVSSVTDR